MDFSSLFNNFNEIKKQNNTANMFNIIKPIIITKLQEHLKDASTGRPRTTNLNKFLDALFAVTEEGIKLRNIKKYFDIPKTTYLRYFKICKDLDIFNLINKDLLDEYNILNTKDYITDVEIIKSVNGSKGVGKNPTDRGRKGIKASIITTFDSIITETKLAPANVHDSKILKDMKFVNKNNGKKNIFADSAYVGMPLKNYCAENNIRIVSVQKKKRNGRKSHYLQTKDRIKLKKRWTIERTISMLRQFRGICTKRTYYVDSFNCMFNLAILCINCCTVYRLHN